MLFSLVTILLFLLALLILAVVFGLIWKFKGVKTALVSTGILAVIAAGMFLAAFM